jgi:hypothetical protein
MGSVSRSFGLVIYTTAVLELYGDLAEETFLFRTSFESLLQLENTYPNGHHLLPSNIC